MKISLNSILALLVSLVLVFFFFADKTSTFLIGSEAEVYLLIVVTLTVLLISSRLGNEFLEILNVVFVGFYICRIPFIFSDSLASDVISRHVDMSNISWMITILTLQYLSLAFCILVVNPRVPRVNLGVVPEFVFRRILFFSFLVILVNAVRAFFFNMQGGTSSHLLAILTAIFTVDNALALIFIASLMIERKVFRKYKFGIIFCVLLFIFCYLYTGSKASLLQVILLGWLATVTVHGPVVFRWRSLLMTGLLGLGAFLLIFVGKIYRVFQADQMKNVGVDQFVFFFNRFFIEQSSISDLLNVVSERIGYLDFFIQKISNPVYEPYVSFTYYFKALVDKLTPGFDVFDVPFASRAIYSAYHGPSVGVLNSELITVFGESYLLLGFFSFVLYLAILGSIKRAFSGFKASSGAAYGLFYMYIIFLFYWWLTGSGLDMLVALMIYQGIFVLFTLGLIRYWFWREKVKTSVHLLPST